MSRPLTTVVSTRSRPGRAATNRARYHGHPRTRHTAHVSNALPTAERIVP